MAINVKRAFSRFAAGERPWRLVDKNWHVVGPSNRLRLVQTVIERPATVNPALDENACSAARPLRSAAHRNL